MGLLNLDPLELPKFLSRTVILFMSKFRSGYMPNPLCDLNRLYNDENGMELWPPTM